MKRLLLVCGMIGVSLSPSQANAQTGSRSDTTHGPGCRMMEMMSGGRMGMHGDTAFAADMRVVHELLANHGAIKRTVTTLPDGIQTLTESDDPRVSGLITDHVLKMKQRLTDGHIFNVASKTLPTLFENRDRIRTTVQPTAKGVAVVQTSDDSATVAALQAHAGEVSDLVQEGMRAMMRACMSGGGHGHETGAATRGDSATRHHRHR